LLVFDRVDASREALHAGLEQARRTGDHSAFALVSVCGGFRGWLLGDLREAEAQGRSAEAIASNVPLLGLAVYAYLSRTLIDRGAIDEAETMLAQRMPKDVKPSLFLMPATLSLAMLRAAQGRWEEAAEVSLSVGRRQVLQGGVHPAIPWRIEAAIALAALDRREEATRLLDEQRPFTERWGIPRHTGQLLRARGHVATGEESLTLLRAAVEQFASSPARLEEARTRLELGAALRRANARTEAREELRLALDLADRCGAWRLTGLAREELAASGARPQRERLSGIDALTGSELRVARMAAEGLSNPEIAQALFVSRKTIETHLGSVYRKLDVNGREALADVLSAVSS
jgi:ATP/maltotriose-dependent transcriptional regulator MalT